MNKLEGVVNGLREEWKTVDWETFSYHTVLGCHNESDGIEACAHHLHSYEDQLQPQVSRLNSELDIRKNRSAALHGSLYDRPLPADDAAMLTHRTRVRLIFGLCVITAAACMVGNLATFVLLGWGLLGAFLAAILMTALPVGLGHPAYERLIAGHRWPQVALIVAIAALGLGAFFELGQARRVVLDRATANTSARSYVNVGGTATTPDTRNETSESGETKVHGTLGGAAFLITMAAELSLAYLVGLLVKLRTDKDYAAWNELKTLLEEIAVLGERLAEVQSRSKRAKRQCMAGIRRAQSDRKRRSPPYHKALTTLIVLALIYVPRSHSQIIQRDEGILIDGSTSISRDLFREYVRATKEHLATEPPNTQVWVSSIGSDSFGVREIVEGWTPEVHGVFNDDLDRARRQLATSFEAKLSGSAPSAKATDIIGGLWHLKALFESGSGNTTFRRTVILFSDMTNDTSELPMPKLLALGPEQMLERVKEHGLLVQLPHYRIYIYGASTAGLTPRSWSTIKRFWELYFEAAGAELMTYSPRCDVARPTQSKRSYWSRTGPDM